MNVRYLNWIAAIALTVVLVALTVPRSFLFSGDEWRLSLREHPWFDYLGVPLYLGGILATASVFSLLGAWSMHALRRRALLTSVARSILDGASIFGLSPLQPVFANIILILLLPTLAESGLFPFESLRWVFTVSLIVLFGIALGAELALRVTDLGVSGIRGWFRALGQVIGAQAPALAGRLAVMVMAGPLLFAAISGIGRSPAEVAPEAQRFAFPNEALIVAFVFSLLGLLLWLLARRVGGRSGEPVHPYPEPSLGWQLGAWGLVALAALLPLVLLFATEDPLLQRFDRVLEAPSAEHRFGTDSLGRDVMDRLVFAWRDTLYAGFSIGVVLFGLGVFWRLITPFNRSLIPLEAILERVPPGVVFFGVWGALSGTLADAGSLRTVTISSGVILVPLALGLIRRVDVRALPAAGAGLALLGMLLVIGWSTVLGMTGLLSPPLPNFGEILVQSRQMRIEAPWIVNYAALTLVVAVVLPVAALTALARCYGISRDLIRLRG